MKIRNKLALSLMAVGLSFSVFSANLKLAYDADPVSLDPHEQLSGGIMQMSHMVFDPLIRFNQDMDFEGRLAEKWERIDDKTMRFHLRKNVTFHSGNDFTADDVVWTFNRLVNATDYKGLFTSFEKIVKIDDYTVDLVTVKGYPLVLQNATYIFPMDSKFYSGKDAEGKDKGMIVKHGNSFASQNQSGTGPFIIKSREQGIKIVFERNPNYWNTESKGNVDELTQVVIKENATRVAALLSGDVDMIAPVAPNDLDRIREAKGIDLITMPGTRNISFQLNQSTNEALKNVKVRQAIAHAVNNEGIVKKIMKGFATAAHQMSPKGFQGHNDTLTNRYDLKKAKELMIEAGYPDGFKLTMIAPNNRYVNDAKIAQAVAAMLSKIKIKVDLKTMPKAQYWPEFDLCEADMLMLGWETDTKDSANYVEFTAMTRNQEKGLGQYNCGHYSNVEVDTLVQDSSSETDVAKRSAQLQKAEKIIYDEAGFLPMHWQNLSWAAKSNVEAKAIVNSMNQPYYGDLVVK